MFALQETLRIAVCGSGTGCCDSNATSGAVTAVLLFQPSPLQCPLALFLGDTPTSGTCWLWEWSCQPRDREARSDHVPWSLAGTSPLARVGKLGLAWGGQEEKHLLGFGGKYREKLPLRVEIQDKTP